MELKLEEIIQSAIYWGKRNVPDFNEISIDDGYHSFDELYAFRLSYNALLFNEWAASGKYDVHKSWKHHDGELCFGDGNWFIVVAILPDGQISNHYKKEHWDKFKVPEVAKSKYEFDGHTGKDVLERLNKLLD